MMMERKASRIAKRLKGWWDDYARKDFTNKSASLSFYTIISIFPLLLVLISFLGRFVSQDVLLRETMRMIDQFFPIQNQAVTEGMESFFSKGRTFGWFGAVTLVLSARLLYLNLERYVNDLLQTDRRRGYVLRRIFFVAWLAGSMIVLLTPLLLGAVRKTLSFFDLFLPSALDSRGIFLVSAFLMFFCAALILPARRIPVGRMLAASGLFAAALVAGQVAFKTLTERSLARYNLVYGSLASMILGAIWIFYFFQIFLMLMDWTGWKRRKAPSAH